MVTINKLLKDKTPFAVMQYFEYLKTLKSEKNKCYELIYVTDKKKLGYKFLTDNEINFVKRNPNIMKLVLDTSDGRIFEYNKFKDYKEANVVIEIPVLTFYKSEIVEFIKNLEDETIKAYFQSNIFKFKKIKERSEKFKECLKNFNLVYEKKPKKK